MSNWWEFKKNILRSSAKLYCSSSSTTLPKKASFQRSPVRHNPHTRDGSEKHGFFHISTLIVLRFKSIEYRDNLHPMILSLFYASTAFRRLKELRNLSQIGIFWISNFPCQFILFTDDFFLKMLCMLLHFWTSFLCVRLFYRWSDINYV